VGPVLAAQFGYLPGTLWIMAGRVLGGAVQDFVILFASMRRDGKSLDRDGARRSARWAACRVVTVLLIICWRWWRWWW
jgi:carbon starvation protein CstA